MIYFVFGLIAIISDYCMKLYERIVCSVNIFIYVIIITIGLLFGIYSLKLAYSKKKGKKKANFNIYSSELIKLNEKNEVDEVDEDSRQGYGLAKEISEKTSFVKRLSESENDKCKYAYKEIQLNTVMLFKSLNIRVEINENENEKK